MTRPLRIAIIGSGLMGRALSDLAPERGMDVAAVLGRDAMSGSNPSGSPVLGAVDVALEFSTPSAAVANIRACLDAGCPVVSGTTGWYDQLPEIEDAVAASDGAVLWSPNFSVGVAIAARMMRLAGALARRAADFDVHLTETHHTAKRDAPSGTALSLSKQVEDALGRSIDITSIRTGFVPGTHELTLDGPFERITISHEARDRRVFADGALTAASWLVGKTGVHTMTDVLDGGDL